MIGRHLFTAIAGATDRSDFSPIENAKRDCEAG